MKQSDKARWKLVYKTTEKYADVFGLRLKKCRLLRGSLAGQCHYSGMVDISLRDSGKSRDPHYVLDSIAHELAHLAFFNHKSEWMRLHCRILSRMVDDGVLDKFRRKW